MVDIREIIWPEGAKDYLPCLLCLYVILGQQTVTGRDDQGTAANVYLSMTYMLCVNCDDRR